MSRALRQVVRWRRTLPCALLKMWGCLLGKGQQFELIIDGRRTIALSARWQTGRAFYTAFTSLEVCLRTAEFWRVTWIRRCGTACWCSASLSSEKQSVLQYRMSLYRSMWHRSVGVTAELLKSKLGHMHCSCRRPLVHHKKKV